MSNLDDLLNDSEFPHRDVPFLLKRSLTAERDAAVHALRLAQQRVELAETESRQRQGGNLVPADLIQARDQAAAEVDRVEEQIREAIITIRITGVAADEYNLYLSKNPPRRGREESFNPSTFFFFVARRTGAQLISAETGETRALTDNQWDKLEKRLTDGDVDRLAQAVLEVNRTEGLRDLDFLSRSSAKTRDSFGISARPEPSASPRSASGAGSRAKSTRTSTTTKGASRGRS